MIDNLCSTKTVWIDHRKMKSEVPELLRGLGGVVRIVNNQITDYVLGGGYGIERKTYNDFLGSIGNKRIFNQVRSLKENFSHPLLIIEKNLEKQDRLIKQSVINGILIFITAKQAVPIIKTNSQAGTAQIIFSLFRYSSSFDSNMPEVRNKRKAITLKQKQERIIEALPGIGGKLAKRALKHFGTVGKFCLSDEKDISIIKGISHQKAREIRQVFDQEY